MKNTESVWLLDGRDAYSYNWHEYDSIEKMLEDRPYFTSEDWDRCIIVKGRKQKVTLKPIVIEVTE
jgi:hypothetical protein